MACLLTPDYRVAFANRSFREKFGEDNGRQCLDYCFGLEGPCELCESYNVLKTGEPHHWEFTSPDGSIIDAYNFPFTDTDGSPLVLEIDFDIIEQKRHLTQIFMIFQRLHKRSEYDGPRDESSSIRLRHAETYNHTLRSHRLIGRIPGAAEGSSRSLVNNEGRFFMLSHFHDGKGETACTGKGDLV